FLELKKTWEMSKEVNQELPEVDVDLAWRKFLDNKSTDFDKQTRRLSLVNWKINLSIAAGLVIFLSLAVSWFLYTSNSSYLEVVSGKNYIKSTLPDGSTVNLNRNASLTFDKQWLIHKRKIFLKQG